MLGTPDSIGWKRLNLKYSSASGQYRIKAANDPLLPFNPTSQCCGAACLRGHSSRAPRFKGRLTAKPELVVFSRLSIYNCLATTLQTLAKEVNPETTMPPRYVPATSGFIKQ